MKQKMAISYIFKTFWNIYGKKNIYKYIVYTNIRLKIIVNIIIESFFWFLFFIVLAQLNLNIIDSIMHITK